VFGVGEANVNPADELPAMAELWLLLFVEGGLLVSIRVMVRPAGTLPLAEPADLRFLVECPEGLVGEAGLERFRGVTEADV